MEILQSLHPNLFLIFELIGFFSFIIILWREILQRNKMRVFEIISCAVFGMILEIGNTYLAHTYSYSNLFLIKIFDVPLAIGLGWAVIIYCAMLLSDQYKVPWTLRPLIDALTAIILDLSMDVIAIRLSFWHWSIPLDQEWYGVPFENLVGWIFVVLSFSYLIRFIRTLNPKRLITKIIMLLSPAISYLGLIISLVVFSIIVILPYQMNNWTTLLKFDYRPDFNILFNPEVQLWKLIIFIIIMVELANLVIFSIKKYHKNYLIHFDVISFSILSLLHIFFLIASFASGIYKQYPLFILLSLSGFLIHCLMHFYPYLLNPKLIYVFKEARTSIKDNKKRLNKIIDSSLR
ncbi:MAG: carotenoid biosynthesis protein [Candidatus Paceibacterota bacterium]|jgi:putative membrane protein